MIRGQRAIVEVSSTSKKLVGLYKKLRLYESTNPTELDLLVQITGN